VRVGLLAKAAFLPFAAAAAAAGLAWVTASVFESPLVQLAAGLAAGGSLYVVVTAPHLILLVTRGRAIHPRARMILRAYHRTGHALGVPVGSPPRHAVRRRIANAKVP
jgi:hypothetical protein